MFHRLHRLTDQYSRFFGRSGHMVQYVNRQIGDFYLNTVKILPAKKLVAKHNYIIKLVSTNAMPYTSLLSRRLNCIRSGTLLPLSRGRLFQRMTPK